MAILTKLADLFNPEVLQDGIDKEYPSFLKFIPLAQVDDTLVGRAGDKITMPAFRYTGDAVEVPEGDLIPLDVLAHSTREVSVKKYGKAIPYTDEAMLSGYGDPVGQIIREHSLAHANKLDNEIVTTFGDATLIHYMGSAGTIDSDHVADALALFGEQEPDLLYMFVSPAQLATLRKNEAWIKVTEIGVEMLMSGVKGQIWGCNVVVSSKLNGAIYIVAPNAVRIVRKRGVVVETEREARRASTTVVSTNHYAVYLYDESKIISLVSEDAPTTYTVSFDVDGGRPVASQTVISGETAVAPMPPVKVGYIFDGWYAEDTFTTAVDFTELITADTTIYAKFVAE